MAIYLKPPEGCTSLYHLYDTTETRLQYLILLDKHYGNHEEVKRILSSNPHLASNSDCLIDGSRKDRITHFILRLASVCNTHFQSFLITAEQKLFQYRIECGGKNALYKCVKDLKRHANHAYKNQRLSSRHQEELLQIIHLSEYLIHSGMLLCTEREYCQHACTVQWFMVLPLIRDRIVIPRFGTVDISCQLLPALLGCIFQTTLALGLKQLVESGTAINAFNDERIARMVKKLNKVFSKFRDNGITQVNRPLYFQDIAKEFSFFPLCMQELHRSLIKSSRLRHNPRFRYSLFLKDIGLPVEESLKFWQHWYSKPHAKHGNGCQHTWEGQDGNRFTYGIRHIYGLEGKKISYTSHSCSALQEMSPQPTDCGGCPYSSYDRDKLRKLISELGLKRLDTLELIVSASERGRPTEACSIMLAHTLLSRGLKKTEVLKKEDDNDIIIRNENEDQSKCCSKKISNDLYDLEDLSDIISHCKFSRPSQYCMKARVKNC
ncbi:unnamed protein product, partial [Meganyctiphanes norvegica]